VATPNLHDSKLQLAAEVLRSRGAIRLQAQGSSMIPTIWPGEILSIESRSYGEVDAGDVVLIMRDGRCFAHRLIEKRAMPGEMVFITRGDALPKNDPPAAETEFLGKVVGIRLGHRLVIPARRMSAPARAVAWAAGRCDPCHNLVLRLHSWWERCVRAGEAMFRTLFSEPLQHDRASTERHSLPSLALGVHE